MSIKCKVYGSYLYCYDKITGAICVYPRQEKSSHECPESVIEAFLKEDFDAEIIFKEEDTVKSKKRK